MNVRATFAVVNTTYAVVKIRPEKENSGIEPMTSAIPVQGSSN